MHQPIFLIFLSLLFILAVFSTSFAQERYLDSLYSVQMETFTYAQKPDEQLGLDIYTPQNDAEKLRPLLLYVHGGGFSGGQRNGERADRFFRQLAQKGYVVATMSYTLTMKGQSFSCDQPTPNKINTFRVAGNDIARATQFLNRQSKQLGIDSTKIVLAGSSAGAEAVLHAAYWPETRQAEEQSLLSEKFRYAGVISMAGALVSLDWVTAETAIPTQFFHGTCDNLVPYGEAAHHYCSVDEPGYMPLYGAEAISDKLRELGKSFYLYTVCRGRHEWAGRPLANNVAEITDFLYHDVLLHQRRQVHTIQESEGEGCPDYPQFNYCDQK